MLYVYVCYLSTYVIGVRMLLDYVTLLTYVIGGRMLFEYVCYISTYVI